MIKINWDFFFIIEACSSARNSNETSLNSITPFCQKVCSEVRVGGFGRADWAETP